MKRRAISVALSGVFAILAFAWAWTTPTYFESDAVQYARITLQYRGVDPVTANAEASVTRCITLGQYGRTYFYGKQAQLYFDKHPEQAFRAADPRYADLAKTYRLDPAWLGACSVYLIDHPMSRDPRYARIFDSRPLLPALAAIAHNWLDLQSSLKVISALSVALAGLLLALTLRVAKLSWPVALGAQVLISFTPFAAWGIRPFTEGISGLGLAAFVLGVALTTVGRVRSGLAVTLAAAAFLVASRSHVAVLAGLAALVCLLVSAKGRALLRRWPVVTGPAAAVIGGIAVPTALGWPGLADSLQDLATVHFAKHDSAQPWRAYLRFLRTFALELLSQPVLVVGILAFAAVLVTAIAAKPTPAMLVAIIAPVAVGLGNTLAHPVIGTAARLFSPAWLGLVAALAVLTAASIDAFRARRSRAAQPG